MGKIIRYIGDIDICKELMKIEENETVPISKNYAIHIQNDKVRFEINKSELLKMCFGIMVANQQLQQIKEETIELSRPIYNSSSKSIHKKDFNVIPLELLQNRILILISEIGDQVDSAWNEYGISFLAKEHDSIYITQTLRRAGYFRKIHPYGKMSGYKLLYNLSEFQRWEHPELRVTINIYFEMNCMSLMSKSFVPMSERINTNAREKSLWCSEFGCYRLNNVSELVFVVTRCVFMYGYFNSTYIRLLNERKNVISSDEFKEEISEVFYLFTDRLIEMMLQEKYEHIVREYITFRGY